MSNTKIKNLGLEDDIVKDFFIYNKTVENIAKERKLPYSAVQRFIVDYKFKNYTDTKLEAISKTSDQNHLQMVDTFFNSAAHMSKEIAFTAIIAGMLREEIAGLISNEGITALTNDNNKQLVNYWTLNVEKLTKLAANMPKYIDTYINMYTQVLDLQRQISYVKVVNDALSEADPVLHKKIMKALNQDSAAKAVIGSLDSSNIVDYWTGNTTPGNAKKAQTLDEEDD